ncbi:hypothetical protein [Sphingomonas alpina]|uniref:Copper resistance protein D domain-containing protein n=1 Tax=Sphingomonas alpina TaxID=653931 RepID=A0A7H0LKS5_9SPHN|nr:hypothetical protein [Sphingomonas alpina]QNQ10278.1 hypothetical protein H3Z74_03285 [Sphingomonas alpina]
MQHMLMIALSLHILAAVFWAGSTFTLARSGGVGAEQLFRPQMGAATVAVLSGIYLWHCVHEGSFGAAEAWLAAGAVCALIAAAVQGLGIGSAVSALRKAGGGDPAARSRIAVACRLAAVLLAVTTVTMAASRYA